MGKIHDCAILCGRVLISALLMWNIAAKQGLVDQSSFSLSPLSGKPILGGLKAENELAKTFCAHEQIYFFKTF